MTDENASSSYSFSEDLAFLKKLENERHKYLEDRLKRVEKRLDEVEKKQSDTRK